MRLIQNTNSDRLKIHLLEKAKNSKVHIASAFFTDWETLEKIVTQNCRVSLIVRLGRGTCPNALEKALKMENVGISFFNDSHFHPKFYVVDDRFAFLGSANFTNNGLMRNQEVMVEFDNEETIFDLQQLFDAYWKQAKPLTENILEIYKKSMKDYPSNEQTDFYLAKKLEKEIGAVYFNNAGIDQPKKNMIERSIFQMQKQYQNFLIAYKQLSDIYEKAEKRRWIDIPIRIEIDRFVWWVGEIYGAEDSYKPRKGLSSSEITKRILSFIPEFISSENKWLEDDAVPRYLLIADAFSSSEKIEEKSEQEIADILGECVFSFNSNRWIKDGLEAHKAQFIELNPTVKIKKTLKYLLFGSDEYPIRLARCIYDSEYKLATLGESGITELFGLTNHEEIPIRNNRIIKTLPWLGL